MAAQLGNFKRWNAYDGSKHSCSDRCREWMLGRSCSELEEMATDTSVSNCPQLLPHSSEGF
jgi:hypothetical protein